MLFLCAQGAPNSIGIDMIKIAEVITRLDWGGSPDIVRTTCAYLDKNQFDVTLVSGPTEHFTRRTEDFIKGFGDKYIVVKPLRRSVGLFHDWRAFWQLYCLCKRGKFDIVHTHTAKAGILGRLAARMAGVPVVIHTPHGHNFYGYFNPIFSRFVVIMERIFSMFTDKIICMTALELNDFKKYRAANPKKLALIYQGLELRKYTDGPVDKEGLRESLSLKEGETVVGFLGRLEPIKGADIFVEAGAYVAKFFRKTKFLVIGEGSLRENLERKVVELGVRHKFIFTGWREDVAQLLSVIDLLVLPSRNEAVGIALIEAQAAGVPVVATRVGGIPEVVNENFTGLLVPPKDPARLAAAINTLLVNPEKRMRMGERAKEWANGRFMVDEMIDKTSHLYIETLEEKKR